jgi:diaminohydroxyphosphoribosylaminopyrimidine deaminase/5-amino-6-(5-phosphoribosylamino)uracil reductase
MDAIIVGGGTVRADDPLLTARPPGSRVATRVVLTASGNLPAECQLIRTAKEIPVFVGTTPAGGKNLAAWRAAGAEVQVFPDQTVPDLLAVLGRRGMTNVLVEGGAGVHGAFVDAREMDEVHVFIAPKLICGTAAPSAVGGRGIDRILGTSAILTGRQVGPDWYLHYRPGPVTPS